jgi:hypothetical protein
MALASAALASARPARRPWYLRRASGPRVFAIGLLAGLSILVGMLWGAGSRQATPSASLEAPSLSISQAPSPKPEPTGRLDALLFGTWYLDFVSSGLDPRPNKELPGTIGSSIRFSHGGFLGGTGYGGGCANFEGTFTVTESAPSALSGPMRLDFASLHQGCGEGSPQQIVEALIGARRFTLMDCGPVPDASVVGTLACRTLRIGDAIDTNVLVYRRGE